MAIKLLRHWTFLRLGKPERVDSPERQAVRGLDVRARQAEVGYIERVMINKVSGKVSYAVINFGGLFGICDDHDPLP